MYGAVSFDNCRFDRSTFTSVYRNQCEPESHDEIIKSLHSNNTRMRITCIRIVQSHVESALYILIGNKTSTECNTFTLARVVVENSTVQRWGISIYGHGPTSFGLVYVSNTDFHRVGIRNEQTGGLVGFHADNCTFTDIDLYGINLPDAVQVNITNCQFRLKDDAECLMREGCSVYVKRVENEPRHLQLVRSLFFPTCLTVHIENSVFVGSAGHTGGAISCVDMNLIISNSKFSLTENSKPAATGGFIHFKGYYNTLFSHNVTFITSATQHSTSISIMAIDAHSIDFRNVHVMCPNTQIVDKEVRRIGFMVSHHYKCEEHCKGDEYTYEAGSAVLQGKSNYSRAANLSCVSIDPNCSSCPVGATCDKEIRALPNYWGYKDNSYYSSRVRMIRCPNEYCCQNDTMCKGIDSCNKDRTGQLCGKCKANLTESLFSPKCLLVDNCPAAEIIALYISCVMAYGLGLMVFNYVKEVGPSVLKKMLKPIKTKCAYKKNKSHSSVEECKLEHLKHENTSGSSDTRPRHRSLICGQESTSEVQKVSHVDKDKRIDKDDDAMKYVQILFYYVQDSALFKVQLSFEGQQDESIVVKILQFSPEVLTTLYTHVSDMCFSSGTTAVTKILFSSLFGPCVMIFIFLLYLGQKCVSHITGKSSKMFKARLVQTFLLVVLFSYQKMVISAFSLVQCVDIGNSTVLYVQGDLECYTWWQYATEVYICLSIIPVFFVLSHSTFYVEDKTMSVQMFILGCLLPVPVMVVHCIKQCIRKKTLKGALQSAAEIQSDTSSVSEHTVVSEQTCIMRHVAFYQHWNMKVDEFFLIMSAESDTSSHMSRDTLGLTPLESDSDTDIGSEYSTDLIRVNATGMVVNKSSMSEKKEKKGEKKFNDSREAITYTLLKHYRCLNVFGVRFTWLSVHKLYRVALVACNTYITDPLKRLCTMSTALMLIAIVNTFTKPYKDRNTNRVSILSYAANICIAFINIMKVTLVTYGCQVNCGSHRDTALWYLSKVENVLLIYLPSVLFPAALLYMGVQKCCGKKKEE